MQESIYTCSYIVVIEVREMKFEEIVDELYERYVKVVKKEEKIEKVREKARELGLENVRVQFDEKTGEAKATIEIRDEKLEEVAEWLIGDRVYVTKLKVVIATAEIEQGDTVEGTLEKANKIGLNYIKYKRIDADEYIDFFEIERDDEREIYVYLAVRNREW